MEISMSEKNGVQILKLRGKILGGPEAGTINDKIHESISRGQIKIIIDMQDLELMNSSGLGILIAAITTLKNNNGKMALIHVPERIAHLLKITKLTNVFKLFDSVEQAEQYLNN